MTIFELGALGEFVGAILLFGSMIFVGMQIRQNTNVAKAQIFQARSDQAIEQYKFMGQPHFLDLIIKDDYGLRRKGSKGIGEIDVNELRDLPSHELYLRQISANITRIRIENNFYQYKNGFLEEEQMDTLREIILQYSKHWDAHGIQVSKGLAEEIERLKGSVG